MRLAMHESQSLQGHVGVYLGAGERGVTEQFLHGPKLRSPLEQMRGEDLLTLVQRRIERRTGARELPLAG